MADLNQATIESIPGNIGGVPIAITATASPGQAIYAVPSDPNGWYEVTLIVTNTSAATPYVLATEWGGNSLGHRMFEQVPAFTSRTLEPRICRGITIYANCLTTAGAAGASGALNIQIKSLKYAQERTP